MGGLSPEIKDWLVHFNRRNAALLADGFKPTPTNVREGLAELTRSLVTQRPEVAWVRDDLVAGGAYKVPVRIYHPAPQVELPVLIYFHGGGHMAGSVTVYDPICRKIALNTQHIVVSADYRRAPECPYPAAVEDAVQVTANIWATLDERRLHYRPRLSIAGDSGGGALCATVAHRAQEDADVNIRCQALIYPSLDYTLSLDSIVRNGTGYLLEKEKIKWYFDNYFQHREDRRAASPLFMRFTRRLPRTLVVTAGFCPLRDEGIMYVEKAGSTGVDVEQLHFDDMIHAFLNMEDLTAAACRATYAKLDTFLNA